MSTTTLLTPYPVRLPAPAVRFLVESWWTCYGSAPHTTWRDRSDSLLATGQPLSAVPPSIRDSLDLEVAPVPGWKGRVPTWLGVSCRIGRATLWLPTQENVGQYRSLSILVLLPQQDPPDVPPFIHLGTQFLLEHQVQVILEGASPGNSRLLIP